MANQEDTIHKYNSTKVDAGIKKNHKTKTKG